MAVPARLTAIAGDKATATDVNAGVRDPINFHLDPPRAHVYDGGATSCVNATATVVGYNSEVYDSAGLHGATVGRPITFPEDGLYRLDFGFGFPLATYTALTVDVRENSTTAADGTLIRQWTVEPFGGGLQFWSIERFFTATEWIQVYVTQTSGANRAMSAVSFGTWIIARWVAIS